MSETVENYYFREIDPRLFIGTTSDRYAGWLDQIYTADKYSGRITTRRNTVGGKTFIEEVLPVDSVKEYFEHFPVLEIDFTFYRSLLDENGEPTPNFHVLRNYHRHMRGNDRVILKVPQTVFATKIRKGKGFVENKDYLNSRMFRESFYEPAASILGVQLSGMVFEQEYQRKSEQTTSEALAADLDAFFSSIPSDDRYHVEIRTPRLLSPPLFQTLKKHGVGLVMSHWTWLPSLVQQYKKSGGAPFNKGNSLVVRLLTPRGKTYADTYAAAHPFDRMVEGMLHPSAVQDTVTVIRAALQDGRWVYLLINNRAGGNAPLIAVEIIDHFGSADSHD